MFFKKKTNPEMYFPGTVALNHHHIMDFRLFEKFKANMSNSLLSRSSALEKEMATHSSVLAWRIPGTGEPGGLLSMGLHRVGHDSSDLAAAAAAANHQILSSFALSFVFDSYMES